MNEETITVEIVPDERFDSTRDHTFYFSNDDTGQWYSGAIEFPYQRYTFELPRSAATGETDLTELNEKLTEIAEIENSRLESAERSEQIAYNTYTLTAYIFAVVLGFCLINLFKGVINSVLGG